MPSMDSWRRVLNQQTVLGAYLDPIADKALLASSFVTLSVLHVIPGWLTVIVISRDFIILLGISVLSIMSISVEIRPLFISKITTALQLMTVLLALFARCLPGWVHHDVALALYWVTALFTIISGLHYMVEGPGAHQSRCKKVIFALTSLYFLVR